MKTEFTNAEKVSSNFLRLKFEEIIKRIGNFVYNLFKERFESIEKSDEDNYQKLKKLIHLESEIEEYVNSKEVVFDIVGHEFTNKESDSYNKFYENQEYEMSIRVIEHIDEYIALISGKDEWNSQLYEEQKKAFCVYLSIRYLDNVPANKILQILNSLNEEDIKKCREIVRAFYRNQFINEIMLNVQRGVLLNKNYKIDINMIFDDKWSDRTVWFVTTTYVMTYLDNFKYDENDEVASDFKAKVNGYFIDPCNLTKGFRNIKFWEVLLYFDRFHKRLNENNEIIEDYNPSNSSIKVVLKKATEQTFLEIEESPRLLCDMDFRGFYLPKVNFNGCCFINCNLEDTSALIDFNEINLESNVYYVRGKKIDRKNLINTCFKGCDIINLSREKIKDFAFSIDTFDETVLISLGLYFNDVDEKLLDKFYRKAPLTISEVIALLTKGVDVAKRYSGAINEPNFVC